MLTAICSGPSAPMSQSHGVVYPIAGCRMGAKTLVGKLAHELPEPGTGSQRTHVTGAALQGVADPGAVPIQLVVHDQGIASGRHRHLLPVFRGMGNGGPRAREALRPVQRGPGIDDVHGETQAQRQPDHGNGVHAGPEDHQLQGGAIDVQKDAGVSPGVDPGLRERSAQDLQGRRNHFPAQRFPGQGTRRRLAGGHKKPTPQGFGFRIRFANDGSNHPLAVPQGAQPTFPDRIGADGLQQDPDDSSATQAQSPDGVLGEVEDLCRSPSRFEDPACRPGDFRFQAPSRDHAPEVSVGADDELGALPAIGGAGDLDDGRQDGVAAALQEFLDGTGQFGRLSHDGDSLPERRGR